MVDVDGLTKLGMPLSFYQFSSARWKAQSALGALREHLDTRRTAPPLGRHEGIPIASSGAPGQSMTKHSLAVATDLNRRAS